MPDSRVQLTVEIETEGAEKLTALRRELQQVGTIGADAFTGLTRSMREAFLEQRRFVSSLEPVFQNFFRRLLSGATGFRDAFKRLLGDLLGFFLRTISRMVVAWLGGLRQMSAAPLSGGGGLLAGLIPSLLTPLSGVNAAGTPPFFPAAGGGGATATNIGLLGRLGIDLRSLGPLSGSALASGGLLGVLAGFQTGSRTLGTLGGAAAGFAFGGPVGAAIGAVIGFFAGLFGRGKKKRQAARAEEALRRQLKDIVEQFRQFQLDFDSALAAVQQSFLGFQQAVAPLGKFGRRAVESVTPGVRQAAEETKRLQQTRDTRAALIRSLPIPEFASGGFVDDTLGKLRAVNPAAGGVNTSSGRLLAFLHRGEAVLNAAAVRRLGRGTIEQANNSGPQLVGRAGMSAPPVTLNLHPGAIVVHAAPGMDEQQLAALTLRELQRRLQDRGLRLGS